MSESDPLARMQQSLVVISNAMAHRVITDEIARKSGHALTATSWNMLSQLESQGELRVSDIAACHGVDTSSVTPRLALLEEAGFVSRSRLSSDGRVSLMKITPAGSAALSQYRWASQALLESSVRGIDGWEVEAAALVLESIASTLANWISASATARYRDEPGAASGDRDLSERRR